MSSAPAPAVADLLLMQATFDIILLDINLPGRDGIEFVGELCCKDPDRALVMMTAFASVGTAAAVKVGRGSRLKPLLQE